jgi:hypothetical protein
MRNLQIIAMVLAILSLPINANAQEVSVLEESSDTVCVKDMKELMLRPGCKVKVGYMCCA